jgi:2,3-bisphosphoglycerate-independent phosphoglycerate mutase
MKYIVIIGDGMADFPIEELDGKTPLMAADKPSMDFMAQNGFRGNVLTIPAGFPSGSDVACMSIFGYDPAKYYTGRAPIEAYGMGVSMNETDVAFRCNLVYLEVNLPRVVMSDYSGGHITTEEAAELVRDLESAIGGAAGNNAFRFYPGVSYRHLMIWKNGKEAMQTTPPHDILDKEVIDYLPRGEGASTLVKLMSDSQVFLKDHPVNRKRQERGLKPANSIWLWGQGKKPYFPRYVEKYGVRGAAVTAVDLIKGIGALAGFETPSVKGATGYLDTDYGAKARAALALLDHHDIVYVHVEAPDEASHNGSLKEKTRAIERIDKEILEYLLGNTRGDVRFLLTTDHATPLSLRTHYACPVPFVIYEKHGPEKPGLQKGGQKGSGRRSYHEDSNLVTMNGEEMITRFLKG